MAASNRHSRRIVEYHGKQLEIIALTLVPCLILLVFAYAIYACAKNRRNEEREAAKLVQDIELAKRQAGGETSRNGNAASQLSTSNRAG
jgi:hypothetical protein